MAKSFMFEQGDVLYVETHSPKLFRLLKNLLWQTDVKYHEYDHVVEITNKHHVDINLVETLLTRHGGWVYLNNGYC